jgi:CRISPR system Cascade subunit CasB
VTAARLLNYLRQLEKDRGAMADLRCALSPTKIARAWPLLARVGGIGNPRLETVAGLFAYHPMVADNGNIGTTCRLLAANTTTFDNRFRRLLSCDRDEICERLRPVILAAKAKGIPVNYKKLFVDLHYWSDPVKASWAQEYWGVFETEDSSVGLEAEGTQ